MGQESPSDAGDRGANLTSKGNGPGAGTRYDVGPGFEIAVRAALNHPIEVQVKRDGEGGEPPKGSGVAEHRHQNIERRLDAIERALFILVDQLKRLDERLATAPAQSAQAQSP